MDFVTEWFWFFLFVPLAALAGWVIGRRGGQRHGDSQVSRLSSTYFRGLNYLLNEQLDKAIELFLHIAELDKGNLRRPRSRWATCSAAVVKSTAPSACTRAWSTAMT
jgi:hypothetical protein